MARRCAKALLCLILGFVATPSPLVAQQDLPLGLIIPGDERGSVVTKAAQSATDEVNRAGGIHGRRVKLMIQSEPCQPNQVSPVSRLAEFDKVLAVFGFICVEGFQSAAAYLRDHPIMAVSFTVFPGVDAPNRFSYFSDLHSPAVASVLRYSVEKLGSKSFAILADRTLAGQIGWASWKKPLADLKATSVLSVQPDESLRFPDFLPRVVQKKADAVVFFTGSLPGIRTAVSKYKEVGGLKALAWVGPITTEPELGRLTGQSRVLVPLFYRSTSRFQSLASAGLSEGFGLFVYDVVSMWAQAARRARELTPSAISTSLDTLLYSGISGRLAVVARSPKRVVKEFSLAVGRNGGFKVVQPEFICIPVRCPCWPWC
jgi:branched-chain amino acid transport system substrate-binding protein